MLSNHQTSSHTPFASSLRNAFRTFLTTTRSHAHLSAKVTAHINCDRAEMHIAFTQQFPRRIARCSR
jgi:hypothetical protein